MIRWVATASTDVGLKRSGNEDSFLKPETGKLFAVADGMGGHAGGEVASSLAVEALEGWIGRLESRGSTELTQAVLDANSVVYKRATADDRLDRMGTTVTAAYVDDLEVRIAHVGDSRAYLLRNGELSRLTKDQTLVQQLIEAGEITEDEARTHPKRSFLTQALGTEPDIEVATSELIALDGDRILLCTDGLHGYVEDSRIAELLANPDPGAAAASLVAEANSMGGSDNVTVLILDAVAEDVAEMEATSAIPMTPTESFADSGRAAEPDNSRRGISGRTIGVIGGAAAVAAAVIFLVSTLLGSATTQYVVANRDGSVVVLKGSVATKSGQAPTGEIVRRTDISVADLPDTYVRDLNQGIQKSSLNDALDVVESLKLAVPRKLQPDATPVPSASPGFVSPTP